MNEIKVEPYIPDEDYDNPAMVVDFYEFTMANCLFLHGFKDTTLVFDMFFRKNPDNQGYSISAGQRKLTRFLLDYHFNEQDIHWLRTKGMSEEFCEYLRTYRWKGDMYALPEGSGTITIGGVDSPTTFDAGIGAYVGMALASVGGMAWMRRRKR